MHRHLSTSNAAAGPRNVANQALVLPDYRPPPAYFTLYPPPPWLPLRIAITARLFEPLRFRLRYPYSYVYYRCYVFALRHQFV